MIELKKFICEKCHREPVLTLDDKIRLSQAGQVPECTYPDCGQTLPADVRTLDKDGLEAYAKARFGVDLDKRLTKKNMFDQIKTLIAR